MLRMVIPESFSNCSPSHNAIPVLDLSTWRFIKKRYENFATSQVDGNNKDWRDYYQQLLRVWVHDSTTFVPWMLPINLEWWVCLKLYVNTLRPRQNGRHFADDIFNCIFLNKNVWIPIKISLKFVPDGPINNIPSLVQIMVWHRSGAKPLSEPMMVSLLTHICVTRPQLVNCSTSMSAGNGRGSEEDVQKFISNNSCTNHYSVENNLWRPHYPSTGTIDCEQSCDAAEMAV